MDKLDLIALIVTILAVTCFSVVFTLLFGAYTKITVEQYNAGRFDVDIIDEFAKADSEKKIRRKQIISSIKRVVGSVVFAIIAIFLIIGIVNRISGNATAIGNKMLMVVASGSMEKKHEDNKYLEENNLNDQFPTYSVIVLQKVKNADELKKYDVIAYRNKEGIIIIHRIVSVNPDGTYTTKGDANNGVDEMRPSFDDVVGKYSGKYLPTIGVFIVFFQSYSGIATVLAVIYCMIMFDNRIGVISEARQKRKDILIELLSADAEEISDNVDVRTEYFEKLYLDKFIYHFDDNGFISKEVADEIVKYNPPPSEHADNETE